MDLLIIYKPVRRLSCRGPTQRSREVKGEARGVKVATAPTSKASAQPRKPPRHGEVMEKWIWMVCNGIENDIKSKYNELYESIWIRMDLIAVLKWGCTPIYGQVMENMMAWHPMGYGWHQDAPRPARNTISQSTMQPESWVRDDQSMYSVHPFNGHFRNLQCGLLRY